jgi:hypothetical protein
LALDCGLAHGTTGFGGATIEALPIGAVKELMRKHGYPAQ